jgi:hypothetical protein
MTADAIDERDLPAMPMVWPIERLASAPKVAIPEGYIDRTCLDLRPDWLATGCTGVDLGRMVPGLLGE